MARSRPSRGPSSSTAGLLALHDEPNIHIIIGLPFAAVIGFDPVLGSIIAFAKLQEILSGKPISVGRPQQPLNCCCSSARSCAVVIGLGADNGGVSQLWMIGLLVLAGVLGLMVVLPIGGADMPVVISLLNALTGLPRPRAWR